MLAMSETKYPSGAKMNERLGEEEKCGDTVITQHVKFNQLILIEKAI